MSDAAAEEYEDNPALQKLMDIQKEFRSHSERLAARSKQIENLEHVTPEVKELFMELSQTGLSLQGDMIDAVVEAVSALPSPEPVSMLLPEDADTVGAVIEAYQDLLNHLIQKTQDKATLAAFNKQLVDAGEALELIDSITVGDEEEGDAEGEPATDDEGGDEETN